MNLKVSAGQQLPWLRKLAWCGFIWGWVARRPASLLLGHGPQGERVCDLHRKVQTNHSNCRGHQTGKERGHWLGTSSLASFPWWRSHLATAFLTKETSHRNRASFYRNISLLTRQWDAAGHRNFSALCKAHRGSLPTGTQRLQDLPKRTLCSDSQQWMAHPRVPAQVLAYLVLVLHRDSDTHHLPRQRTVWNQRHLPSSEASSCCSRAGQGPSLENKAAQEHGIWFISSI